MSKHDVQAPETDLPTVDLMPGADPIDDGEDLGNIDSFYDEGDDEIRIDPTANTADSEPAPDAAPSVDADQVDGDSASPEPEPTPEVDPEPEPEPEVEPESEPAPEQRRKVMIPKDRMDREAAKRREAEARVQELEQKLREQSAPKVDPDAVAAEVAGLLSKANEALLDGDLEQATQLQRDAMAKQQAVNAPVEQEKIDPAAIREQIKEELRVEQILESSLEKFPALNQESDDFDQELYDQAVDLQEFYVGKGYTLAQALQKAVNDSVSLRRPDLLQAPEKPAPKQPAPPRKVKTVDDKIKAANAQPPQPQGESSAAHTAETIDVSKLSIEEYEALPESTLARLRGDTL